jgi:hypothetical protein
VPVVTDGKPPNGSRALSDAEYEAELPTISAMSDAECRAIEAAEQAVEVRALEGDAAKSKALPSSAVRPRDTAYTRLYCRGRRF